MKHEDLIKGFNFFVDSFVNWLGCLINPDFSVKRIVDLSTTNQEALKQVANFFIAPFFISLFIQSWAYQLYGIGLSDIGLHITLSIFAFILLVTWAIVVYFSLRLFRIRVPFKETLITYSIYMSIYLPIFALFSSPGLSKKISTLKEIKSSSPDIENIPKLFFTDVISSQNTGLSIIAFIFSMIISAAFIVVLSLVLDSLSTQFELNREKVFSAGAFSMILATPIMFLAEQLPNIFLYAHL